MKGTFLALGKSGKLRRIDRRDAEFKEGDQLILQVSPQNGKGARVRVRVLRNDFDPDKEKRRKPHSLRRQPEEDE